MRLFLAFTTSALMFAATGAAVAQTVGYAEAIGQFAAACSQDMDKFCKTTNLGGGRTQQCLDQNQAGVSANCKATMSALRANLQKRAAARAAVLRACDVDIRRYCAGIQQGDGNLMECFYKARRNMSAQCQQNVVDAGYDVSIGAAPHRTLHGCGR
jgi:OOP family OmpA-OmpF porin